jgi:GntR family transcriptional regulator/MocR family aminotransferase
LAEWKLAFFLDPESVAPVYLQIAQALIAEVQRGRLRPGDPLPGYRTLAEQLGVARNTVMAAYQELQAGGWVSSHPGMGSAIAEAPPLHLIQSAAPATSPSAPKSADRDPLGFELAGASASAEPRPPPGLMQFGSGVPDARLLPGEALARAYRRALKRGGDNPLALEDSQGHPLFREALAAMLASTRGISASPERIFVTRGSQHAFFLAAEAILFEGAAVAVEALGDRGAWEAFARAGARCLPVPVDPEGIDVEALAAIAARERLRAVLVTPQRQYPTLAVLSPQRRERLLDLAAQHRFAVLEADQDAEFQFEGRPLAPLAAADRAGVVVHVGTLSKLFSPGLRLGFVHGPSRLVRQMKAVRLGFDRQGDLVLERAMAELMEDGELQAHVNRMHEIYRRRRDVLCTALGRALGGAAQVPAPPGGLALWVKVAPDVDVDAWAAHALRRGVVFRPGRHFSFERAPVQGLRVGFSSAPEDDLEELARRMGAALADVRR